MFSTIKSRCYPLCHRLLYFFFLLLSFLCKWENVLIIIHAQVLHCKVGWFLIFLTWHYWVYCLLLFEDYHIFRMLTFLMCLFTHFNLLKKKEIDLKRVVFAKCNIENLSHKMKKKKTKCVLGNNKIRKENTAKYRYFFFIHNSTIDHHDRNS